MTDQSGWLPTRTGALWSGLHQPDGAASGRAVVIVPPFGWEGMSSGRQLRAWARDLAARGHVAVRYQPPGEGDSEGISDAQDLTTWSTALVDVAQHTRALPGVRRVTLLALGLGVPVALAAAAGDCPADELVLWAGQGRGRPMLRELRAFAAMTNAADDDPTGTLWVTGHPLGVSAQEQLAGFDATALDLSRLSRVLLLGRASLPTDSKLAASLESQGVAVSREPGPGYDELTVEPRLSQAPTHVRDRVARWLLEVPVAGTEVASAPWPVAATAESVHEVGPARVVVSKAPGATATAVFLSAGAVSRSGPNRLWTEAARRWTDRGVSSVRVDLAGIGEADGPDTWPRGPEGFYDPSYADQIGAVIDALPGWGLPDRVLAIGLCSGGYWAAQTALVDDRVRAAALLNTYSLVWPPPLADLGVRGRIAHLSSWRTWRPLLRDRAARADAVGRVRRSVRARRGADVGGAVPGSTIAVLDRLDERGVTVLVGLSPGEVALADVATLSPSALRHVYTFTGPEDAHTLSPPELRRQAERALDTAASVISVQELGVRR